jgi:hypothetical protein
MTIVLGAFAVGVAGLASASPLMIVTCEAQKGINLAASVERDVPKSSISVTFDPDAGGYVSHPRDTSRSIITVNRDGTATETSFTNDGKAMVSDLRIVGKINKDAMSFIEGEGGGINLYTLYPNGSLVVITGTSYFGWHKAIPTGFAYISHCNFSNVLL